MFTVFIYLFTLYTEDIFKAMKPLTDIKTCNYKFATTEVVSGVEAVIHRYSIFVSMCCLLLLEVLSFTCEGFS